MTDSYKFFIQKKNQGQLSYGIKVFTHYGFQDLNILSRGYACMRGFELAEILRKELMNYNISKNKIVQI